LVFNVLDVLVLPLDVLVVLDKLLQGMDAELEVGRAGTGPRPDRSEL